MRYLLWLAVAASGWAAGPATATVTGRVFDVYHRPVRQARVAAMKKTGGHLVPAAQVLVDDTGMYRLSLIPGSYVLAVLPPPRPLDFATVFPVYFQDTVKFEEARTIGLRPGELRPFTDFLLLEVESHRLEGTVTGIPPNRPALAVTLSSPTGYTGPLQTVAADPGGHFRFDHVASGTYLLRACVPISEVSGFDSQCGSGPSGSIQIHVSSPDTVGIQIHLLTGAR